MMMRTFVWLWCFLVLVFSIKSVIFSGVGSFDMKELSGWSIVGVLSCLFALSGPAQGFVVVMTYKN